MPSAGTTLTSFPNHTFLLPTRFCAFSYCPPCHTHLHAQATLLWTENHRTPLGQAWHPSTCLLLPLMQNLPDHPARTSPCTWCGGAGCQHTMACPAPVPWHQYYQHLPAFTLAMAWLAGGWDHKAAPGWTDLGLLPTPPCSSCAACTDLQPQLAFLPTTWTPPAPNLQSHNL